MFGTRINGGVKLSSTIAMAMGLLAGSQTSQGSVMYEWWSSGLGWNWITYDITCRDGSRISGQSSARTGIRACPDGSNSLAWQFNTLWWPDINSRENKGNGGNSSTNMTASLDQTGTQFAINGGTSADTSEWQGEIGVVRAYDRPGSFALPGSLDQYVSASLLNPSQVLMNSGQLQGPYDQHFNSLINLASPSDGSDLLMTGYSAGTAPEPGTLGLLAISGFSFIGRLRRKAA